MAKRKPQDLRECLERLNAHYNDRLSPGMIADFHSNFSLYPLDWMIQACQDHITDGTILSGQPTGKWPPTTADLMSRLDGYNQIEKAKQAAAHDEQEAQAEVQRKADLEALLDPNEMDDDNWLVLDTGLKKVTGRHEHQAQTIRVPRRESTFDCRKCGDKGRVIFWFDFKNPWRVYTKDAALKLSDALFRPLRVSEALCRCSKGQEHRNRLGACIYGSEGRPPTAILIEKVETLERKRIETERLMA